MKKLVLILLTAIMLFSLAGCGNSESKGENSGGNTTEKVTFEEVEDYHELLSGMPLRDKMEFAFYENLETHPVTEEDLFISHLLDKPQTEVSFSDGESLLQWLGERSNANDYEPYRIVLNSDIDLDCTKYSFTVYGNETEFGGSLNNGVLVISSAATFTISGRSANDMAIFFPIVVMEKGSKLILDNNANICPDILLMQQDSVMELRNGRCEASTLVNYGTITSTHEKSYLRVMDGRFYEEFPNFYNSKNAVIDMQAGLAQIALSQKEGNSYSDENYGLDTERFSGRPLAMNCGTISTGDNGFLEFNTSNLDEGNTPLDKFPIINAGVINIGTNNLKELYGFTIDKCHFQNYGTLNLIGAQDQASLDRELVSMHGEAFENYGTINVSVQYGLAILRGNHYFINYEGAVINDNTGANASVFQPKELDAQGNFFFNNVSRTGDISFGEVNRAMMLAIAPYEKLFDMRFVDDSNSDVNTNEIHFTAYPEESRYLFSVFGAQVSIDEENYTDPPITIYPEFEAGTMFEFKTTFYNGKHSSGVEALFHIIVSNDGETLEYNIDRLDGNTIISGIAKRTNN